MHIYKWIPVYPADANKHMSAHGIARDVKSASRLASANGCESRCCTQEYLPHCILSRRFAEVSYHGRHKNPKSPSPCSPHLTVCYRGRLCLGCLYMLESPNGL